MTAMKKINNNNWTLPGLICPTEYGVQAWHRIYVLIGQELVFEYEYAG